MNQRKKGKSQEKDNFINFNKQIYPRRAIVSAIADFSDLAVFDLRESKGYFTLAVRNIVTDPKNFVDEFSNYVLGPIEK